MKESEDKLMNKKLVIVTTDMEIELAMFVDASKLTNTREAIAETREKYYEEDCHSELFDDVLSDIMQERGIEFEFVDYEEM
jgi:hypothetical protein